MHGRIIGRRSLFDGTEYEVYEDPDGRQYIIHDGEPSYGDWLMPADEPIVVICSENH